MSAETTARRVMAWAAALDGQGRGGQLPTGPLWGSARLAAPQPATLALASQLAKNTAARLGTTHPPFGDQQKIGIGPVLLAAAVGGRGQPERARRLALTLPASRPVTDQPREGRWYDLIARHGVVAPALANMTADRRDEAESLAETLLRASPLTAVLHRPALRRLTADTTGDEVEAAAALVLLPRGQAVLSAALSQWNPDVMVLNWRTELLDRLGHGHPDLVLDTYTLARLRHGAAWDSRLDWAKRTLSMPGPPDRLAIATVRFWGPLARLRQRGVVLADARPLLSGYRPALQLVSFYRLLTTGPA